MLPSLVDSRYEIPQDPSTVSGNGATPVEGIHVIERPRRDKRGGPINWERVGAVLGVIALGAGALWWAVGPKFVDARMYQQDQMLNAKAAADAKADSVRAVGEVKSDVAVMKNDITYIRTGIDDLKKQLERRR